MSEDSNQQRFHQKVNLGQISKVSSYSIQQKGQEPAAPLDERDNLQLTQTGWEVDQEENVDLLEYEAKKKDIEPVQKTHSSVPNN